MDDDKCTYKQLLLLLSFISMRAVQKKIQINKNYIEIDIIYFLRVLCTIQPVYLLRCAVEYLFSLFVCLFVSDGQTDIYIYCRRHIANKYIHKPINLAQVHIYLFVLLINIACLIVITHTDTSIMWDLYLYNIIMKDAFTHAMTTKIFFFLH